MFMANKDFLLSRHGARIPFPNGIFLSIHNGPQNHSDGAMETMSEVIRYEVRHNGVTNLVRPSNTVELWIGEAWRDEHNKQRERLIWFAYDERRPRNAFGASTAYGKGEAPFLPHVTSTELATIMGLAASATNLDDLWDLLIPSFGAAAAAADTTNTTTNTEDNSND
jgi:hypothetical protein